MRAAMSPAVRAGLAACTLGCQAAPAPRAIEVAVRGDGIDVAIARTPAGCLADAPITVGGDVIAGSAVIAGGGWRLAPGPAGRELTDRGALVARIVDEPGRRSYLDPTGVPLARVAFDAGGATITDGSRTPVGAIARDESAAGPRDGDALVWRDAGGRRLAIVTGTDDVEVAAALVAPAALPAPARALVACARLHAIESSRPGPAPQSRAPAESPP